MDLLTRFLYSPKQKVMKRAPKRRSFWEYNRDNGYWVVWAITIFFSVASFSQSTAMSLGFLGVGIVTVIVGLIDWRRLG